MALILWAATTTFQWFLNEFYVITVPGGAMFLSGNCFTHNTITGTSFNLTYRANTVFLFFIYSSLPTRTGWFISLDLFTDINLLFTFTVSSPATAVVDSFLSPDTTAFSTTSKRFSSESFSSVMSLVVVALV